MHILLETSPVIHNGGLLLRVLLFVLGAVRSFLCSNALISCLCPSVLSADISRLHGFFSSCLCCLGRQVFHLLFFLFGSGLFRFLRFHFVFFLLVSGSLFLINFYLRLLYSLFCLFSLSVFRSGGLFIQNAVKFCLV